MCHKSFPLTYTEIVVMLFPGRKTVDKTKKKTLIAWVLFLFEPNQWNENLKNRRGSTLVLTVFCGNPLCSVKSLKDLCCHYLCPDLHLNSWHCLSAHHGSGPTRQLINRQLVNCDPVLCKARARRCCHLCRSHSAAWPHSSLGTWQT